MSVPWKCLCCLLALPHPVSSRHGAEENTGLPGWSDGTRLTLHFRSPLGTQSCTLLHPAGLFPRCPFSLSLLRQALNSSGTIAVGADNDHTLVIWGRWGGTPLSRPPDLGAPHPSVCSQSVAMLRDCQTDTPALCLSQCSGLALGNPSMSGFTRERTRGLGLKTQDTPEKCTPLIAPDMNTLLNTAMDLSHLV